MKNKFRQKKIYFILTIFLIAAVFLFRFLVPIKAQTPTSADGGMIDFLKCGNAEADEPDLKKCCQPPKVEMPSTVDAVGKFPVLGSLLDILGGFKNLIERQEYSVPCRIGYPSTTDPSCICLQQTQITPTPLDSAKKLCEKYLFNSPEYNACKNCAESGGIQTALTCVYGNLSDFVSKILLGWGVGLAGIIALLCIIYSAFQIQTSQGNPEKIKKAQELLTSCIMGLMLIIFSIFILRVIGVDILRIPGFK